VAALTDVVSPLKIDGVEASPDAVLDGTYGIARPFILLTKGEAGPLEQHFINFVLGPDGQLMLEDEGMVRVN
jgi:phosphate transport system substrate-binding protein